MRTRWLAVVLLVLIGLMVFPQLAFAAEPEPSVDAEPAGEPRGLFKIVLDVTFDENGEWVAAASIESPGMKPIPGLPNFIAGNLRLEDQSYESLTTLSMFLKEIRIPSLAIAQDEIGL